MDINSERFTALQRPAWESFCETTPVDRENILNQTAGMSLRDFATSHPFKIVAVEGPNMAGKTTLIRKVAELLNGAEYPCIVIPEYVDYMKGQNTAPEHPLQNEAEMLAEANFFLHVEHLRQQDMIEILARHKNEDCGLLILDRCFFTCLAYAELSGNPVSRSLFEEYLQSKNFISPDFMLFLAIDPNSAEYSRRRERRKEKNPDACRGLTYKVEEYSYIYRNTDYEAFFRSEVTTLHPAIRFIDSLSVQPQDCIQILMDTGILKVDC